MATVVLLKENELSKGTLLGGNIDVDLWIPCVVDAQRTKIEETLGETLYNKICTDFENDDLTGLYETLYEDYVKPFLIHQATVEYLLVGAYKVNNNGIFKSQPENTVTVEKAEVDYLVKNQRLKSDMYQGRLERWLALNPLPEYNIEVNEIVPPIRKNALFNRWYIPD